MRCDTTHGGLATCLLTLLLLAAGHAPAQQAGDLAARLLELSNEARAAEDLPPLKADEGLARAAAGHAAELARRGELTHRSERPEDRTPGRRVANAGVALVEVGENVAMIEGSDVAARAVEGWLDSPEHRRNLLDADYSHVGHAAAEAEDGTYLVQVFGARPITRLEAAARVPEDAATSDGDAPDEVILEIRYAGHDLPLALFVGDEFQRGAARGEGLLRTRVALERAPVRVSVGIAEDGGDVRIVEAFELRPGPPPTLEPGAVRPGGDEESSDAEAGGDGG